MNEQINEYEAMREELERLRTQLAGRTYFHSDQAVEDTLSDLMTKYDALAMENAALREALKIVLINHPNKEKGAGNGYALASKILSNPSPQVQKIEAVLEAVDRYFDDRMTEYLLYDAYRNLRGGDQ